MNRFKLPFLLITVTGIMIATALGIEMADNSKFVGHWVFMYKGQKRSFQLNDDRTFEGSYPVSGKHFFGTWKTAESKIILIRGGETRNWGLLTLKPDGQADYLAEGYRMIGQKAEP